MRILLVTPNFYPDKTGIGVSATDCSRLLTQLGHEVHVVTTVPHYPAWEIHPSYRKRFHYREEFENKTVDRVWIYLPKSLKTINRIAYEVSMAISTASRSLRTPCDIILAISPPLSVAVVQAVVATIRRKPFCAYIQDIQPDAAISLGMIRNPVLISISRWMERWVYRSAKEIFVLSEGMKQNIVAKGIAAEKIAVVPVAINLDEMQETWDSGVPGFRATHSLESKYVVHYSGNLGVKQNPELIVECARYLQDHEDIFFVIVGEGACKSAVSQLIETYGLKNIVLLPLSESRSALYERLASVDLLLLTQRKEVVDAVVPSKLLTYFASGTPVVAAVHENSEAGKILREKELGLWCAPEQVEELASSILYLRAHPKESQRYGEAGQEYARKNSNYQVVRDRHYKELFSRCFPQNHPLPKK